MKEINEFFANYFFLSNFYKSPVEYEGQMYDYSESAFQAAKTLNLEVRREFAHLEPHKAKYYGRRLPLREDWEEVKDEVMYKVVYDKFNRNSLLKQKLIETGNIKLVEGNDWNDTYWGVCDGIGKNMLGKILMRVREELK